jgi:hypothetical protein
MEKDRELCRHAKYLDALILDIINNKTVQNGLGCQCADAPEAYYEDNLGFFILLGVRILTEWDTGVDRAILVERKTVSLFDMWPNGGDVRVESSPIKQVSTRINCLKFAWMLALKVENNWLKIGAEYISRLGVVSAVSNDRCSEKADYSKDSSCYCGRHDNPLKDSHLWYFLAGTIWGFCCIGVGILVGLWYYDHVAA